MGDKTDGTTFPHLPPRIGKRGTGRKPLGTKFYWRVVDEIRRIQSNAPCTLCLEKIQFEDDGRIEIRLGYYVIGEKPRMKGKWVWGQYATMMPTKDFKALIDEAQNRGWFD